MHGDLKAVVALLQATEKQIPENPATAGAGDLLTRLTLEEKIKFLQKWKGRKEVQSYGEGRAAAVNGDLDRGVQSLSTVPEGTNGREPCFFGG
jgi:hypothetical protein